MNFILCWFPNQARIWAEKRLTDINWDPYGPDEDKKFRGPLVLILEFEVEVEFEFGEKENSVSTRFRIITNCLHYIRQRVEIKLLSRLELQG